MTFGSFRMGVSGKNSDIDAILVVPCYISRHDFNSIFFQMLKKRSETTSINVSWNGEIHKSIFL